MKTDKWHSHEALDRVHVAQSNFCDHILTHPLIEQNSELNDIATEVQEKMMALYQAIGNGY